MSLPNRSTLTKLATAWKSERIVVPFAIAIFLLSVVDFALFLRLVVPNPPVGSHPGYSWEPILHIIGNVISVLFGLQYVFGLGLGFEAYPGAGSRKGKGVFLAATGVIGIIGFGCLAYFLSPSFNYKLISAITYSNPVSMNTLLNAAASAQASALLGRPTSIVVPFNTTSIWAGSRYFGMVAEYFEADLAIAITLCVLYASMAVSGGLILLDEYRGITGEEEKVEFEAENGSPTSAAGQPEMQTA